MTKNNGFMDKIRQLKSTAIIAAMFSIAIDLECINSAEAMMLAPVGNAAQVAGTIFAIPIETEHRYDSTKNSDWGLSDVKDINEMLKWVDDFWTGQHTLIARSYAHGNVPGTLRDATNKEITKRMLELLKKDTTKNTFKHLCYGTTSVQKIKGAQKIASCPPEMLHLVKDPKDQVQLEMLFGKTADTSYSFDDIIANNCDNAADLKRTILFLHICYHNRVCGGDIKKILKLFLCSDDISFNQHGVDTVGNIKNTLTATERNYIQLVKDSFLAHIGKHWDVYTPQQPLNVQPNLHGEISGLIVYDQLSNSQAINAAMQAMDDLVENVDLSNLQIFVNNGRELSISTLEGFSGGKAYMFEVQKTAFSRHIKTGIAITNNTQPNNVTDISNLVTKKNNSKLTVRGIEFQKQDPSQIMKMFFKFTIPNDIVRTANVSNRTSNMGSFYVRI